jgi:hypothetical protein
LAAYVSVFERKLPDLFGCLHLRSWGNDWPNRMDLLDLSGPVGEVSSIEGNVSLISLRK